MELGGYSRIANGDILPYSFVMADTTKVNRVIQATAGAQIYGISGPGHRFAPYSSLDDGLHAKVDETCTVFGAGSRNVLLKIIGTVAAGNRIKASTNGAGIAAASDGDEYGAIAELSGVSGDIIPVTVVFPAQRGA